MLPVSSSAQLTLLPWLLRWPVPSNATTFAAGLHAGSCLGIGVALRRELLGLDRRTLALLAATSLPAAAAGLLAGDRVEQRLGRPGPIALLLAGAGAVMWAADRRPERVADVGPRQAAVAAAAQVFALAPGVSRFGATVTALRCMQVERAEAQRFSLLMSLPVTAGAAALTLARTPREGLVGPLLVGAPIAALTGGLAAANRSAVKRATGPAAYRLALAAVVASRLRRHRRDSA